MDRYDAAIKYLTENPNAIHEAWINPLRRRGGSLFLFACDGSPSQVAVCGCPVSIRRGTEVLDSMQRAQSPEITNRLREDQRIPASSSEIEVSDLGVFAEYQREFDRLWPKRFEGAQDDIFLQQYLRSGKGSNDGPV